MKKNTNTLHCNVIDLALKIKYIILGRMYLNLNAQQVTVIVENFISITSLKTFHSKF
jgi:hypothetical protein